MSNVLVEALASYAHRAWSGWMEYLFRQGKFNEDGSFTIDAEHTKRWVRQSGTVYEDLPEGEKRSDRKEAREILAVYFRARYRWESE